MAGIKKIRRFSLFNLFFWDDLREGLGAHKPCNRTLSRVYTI
jgi:hypothetical protein